MSLELIEDLGMQYQTEASKTKYRFGMYKCECGTILKARTSAVTSGNTTNCGCVRKRKLIKASTIHGLRKHRLYQTWAGMLQRCTNPKDPNYKNYGGRGITVCTRWLDIENFIEDMDVSYDSACSLDRKDVNKEYSPDNCRWATPTTQARNIRTTRVNNTTGYKGVWFRKTSGKYSTSIRVNSKTIHLGSHITALEAAKAYNTYVIANNLEHTLNNV